MESSGSYGKQRALIDGELVWVDPNYYGDSVVTQPKEESVSDTPFCDFVRKNHPKVNVLTAESVTEIAIDLFKKFKTQQFKIEELEKDLLNIIRKKQTLDDKLYDTSDMCDTLVNLIEVMLPDMECRGDEECDHCHFLSVISDFKKLETPSAS